MVFGLGGEVEVVADEWVTLMSCCPSILEICSKREDGRGGKR